MYHIIYEQKNIRTKLVRIKETDFRVENISHNRADAALYVAASILDREYLPEGTDKFPCEMEQGLAITLAVQKDKELLRHVARDPCMFVISDSERVEVDRE